MKYEFLKVETNIKDIVKKKKKERKEKRSEEREYFNSKC